MVQLKTLYTPRTLTLIVVFDHGNSFILLILQSHCCYVVLTAYTYGYGTQIPMHFQTITTTLYNAKSMNNKSQKSPANLNTLANQNITKEHKQNHKKQYCCYLMFIRVGRQTPILCYPSIGLLIR